MENIDLKIQQANNRKVKARTAIAKGTQERFEETTRELERLRKKRDNLNIQIQALEAKQQSRLLQLQNLTK